MKHVNITIWKETRKTLKLLSALQEKPMVEILHNLANDALNVEQEIVKERINDIENSHDWQADMGDKTCCCCGIDIST